MSKTPVPPPPAELSSNESGFILDTTLKAKHREDPTVIAFIDSFIKCKSISQASAEAGVHTTLGYKYRHRKDIANAIHKLIDKSAVKHGFDASEILERTKEIVDFDPIDLQNPDGTFKSNLHDIPAESRRCLKKLKVRNLWGKTADINGIESKIIIGEIIDYEFYDKLKAAELTGREKEMFKNTTKVEHTLTGDMHSILLESAKRGEQAKIDNNIIDVESREIKGEDV